MKNYYHVLNIPTQATQAQIKAAYKARQAEWNATDSQNMSSYMDIEEAWENLGDDMRRKWYDESLLKEIQEHANNNKNLSEENDTFSKYTPKPVNIAVAGGISLSAVLVFILHSFFFDFLESAASRNKLPYLRVDSIATVKQIDSTEQEANKDTGNIIKPNQ